MNSAFTDREKREMAGESRTIDERLHGTPNETHRDTCVDPDERLAEWADLFDSEKIFRRRLEREGVTVSECREALTGSLWPSDERLPSWVESLDDLVGAVQASSPEDYEYDDEFRDSVPFYEFWWAVVEVATEDVTDSVDRTVLSESAWAAAKRWLVKRCTDAFNRILYVEFKTSVALQDEQLLEAAPEDFEELPTKHYERFVDRLFDDGFGDLCLEYPMFGRLLTTRLRQWRQHIGELRSRIDSDRSQLRRRFEPDADALGPVTDLKILADDTHADGRAVTKVTFESGTSVVYKSRSVRPGKEFYDALDRLTEHADLPPFERPTYCCRESYGWMSWVGYQPCADESAVARYYERAGALLAVTYVLGSVDLQNENVITSGEQPTIVDLETALHPMQSPDSDAASQAVFTFSEQSVLVTSLLPITDGAERHARTAGFASNASDFEIDDYEVIDIEAVNTDVMAVERVHPTIQRSTNIPTVDGDVEPPQEYTDAFLDGFVEMYETIRTLRDRGALRSDIGIPTAFDGVENRFIHRPTRRYTELKTDLQARKCLSDGVQFSLEIEDLAAALFEHDRHDESLWPVFEAERAALKDLEIPRVTSTMDGTSLERNGTTIGADLGESGCERCRRRVNALKPADLAEQRQLIREAFGSTASDDQFPETDPNEAQFDDRELRSRAEALFDHVQGSTIEVGGRDHWVFPRSTENVNAVVLEAADESLYLGRSGIAIAAAGLARVTGDDHYRSVVERTVAPLVERLETGAELRNRAIGGGSGLGGTIYAFSVLGELLENHDYYQYAETLAGTLSDERIADDEQFDVISGSAGATLGLLGLYERTGHDEALTRAIACGDRLLDARVTHDGVRVWDNGQGSQPLTGFSHGAAGIGYALARLGHDSGEQRFSDAAGEALEYEAATYDEDARNWPDFRDNSGDSALSKFIADGGGHGRTDGATYTDSWCHGRTGIGLARVGIARYTGWDGPYSDTRTAFEAVRDAPLPREDDLCCGAAGQIEFLVEAGELLGRGREPARRRAVGLLARRERKTIDPIPNPTFFKGLAGIAYTMVRLHGETQLPCVALWE